MRFVVLVKNNNNFNYLLEVAPYCMNWQLLHCHELVIEEIGKVFLINWYFVIVFWYLVYGGYAGVIELQQKFHSVTDWSGGKSQRGLFIEDMLEGKHKIGLFVLTKINMTVLSPSQKNPHTQTFSRLVLLNIFAWREVHHTYLLEWYFSLLAYGSMLAMRSLINSGAMNFNDVWLFEIFILIFDIQPHLFVVLIYFISRCTLSRPGGAFC